MARHVDETWDSVWYVISPLCVVVFPWLSVSCFCLSLVPSLPPIFSLTLSFFNILCYPSCVFFVCTGLPYLVDARCPTHVHISSNFLTNAFVDYFVFSEPMPYVVFSCCTIQTHPANTPRRCFLSPTCLCVSTTCFFLERIRTGLLPWAWLRSASVRNSEG